MSKSLGPERVHGYRCQFTEDSWVKVSVHRVSMDTGFSPERVHDCRCQSADCSWVQVSIQRGLIVT